MQPVTSSNEHADNIVTLRMYFMSIRVIDKTGLGHASYWFARRARSLLRKGNGAEKGRVVNQSNKAFGVFSVLIISLCATSYAQTDTICYPDQQFSRTDLYAVGQSPGQVRLDDLDQDGDLDAVVLNVNEGTFTVLQGKPGGTFAFHGTYDSGDFPVAQELVDLDRDGFTDLLILDSEIQEFIIFLNNGDAYFTEHSRVEVGPRPHSLKASDFNNDGYTDLVYTNSQFQNGVPRVELLLGGPGFTFEEPIGLIDDIRAFVVSIVDLNQDGEEDLVVLGGNPTARDQGRILIGRGDGTFDEPITFATVGGSSSSTVMDMNNDGHIDVVSAGADGVVVYYGDGTGALNTNSGNIALVFNALHVESTHLNTDGRPDLVVAHSGFLFGGGVALIESNADGITYDTHHLRNPESASWITVADVNNDGRSDIVASEDQADALVVLPDQCEACPADLNGDRVLDARDVNILLRPNQGVNRNLDYNLDGEVNFYDISAFLSDFALGCR